MSILASYKILHTLQKDKETDTIGISFSLGYIAMTPERLNEVKKQVQTILDHHLPEEKRFSVEDFDEATLLLLTQFLLAKDKSERDKIRVKIQKTVKKKKMELDLISNDMLESVDSIKSLSNTKKEISSLEEIIIQDNDLDEQLNIL